MQNHEIPDVEQRTWWQRNKKRVLIAGSVAVVVGGILLYKNWDSVTKLAMKVLRQGQKPAPQPIEIHVDLPVTDVVHEAQRPVLAIINGGEAFPVNGHIRNLPASWTPSPERRRRRACKRPVSVKEERENLRELLPKNDRRIIYSPVGKRQQSRRVCEMSALRPRKLYLGR